MRCVICNVVLDSHEILTDPRTGKFEPCGLCKKNIYDAIEELNKEYDEIDMELSKPYD